MKPQHSPLPEVLCPGCLAAAAVRLLVLEQNLSVAGCLQCGHQFLWPREDGADYWRPDNVAVYQEEFAASRRKWQRTLCQAEPPPDHARTMLDVGCGLGRYVQYARQAGWEAYGYDISEQAVGLAPPEVQAFCRAGSSVEQCFPGRRFEVVTAWDVLEHVPEPDSLLTQIAGCLAPSGTLLLETPASEFVGRRAALWSDAALAPRLPGVAHRFYHRAHPNYFSRASLYLALARTGFEVLHHELAVTDRAKVRGKLRGCLGQQVAAFAMAAAQTTRLIRGNKHLVICRKARGGPEGQQAAATGG